MCQPRWLSGLRRSRVHSLWLLVDHCVLRNRDRILVRAVKGLISRAGMVSICPLLWQTKLTIMFPWLWFHYIVDMQRQWINQIVVDIDRGNLCSTSSPFPCIISHQLTYHYIPEKRKFSGILCFRQQRSRRPHNFVVSAITFDGFKLRSSNLTHALLIQISRTSSIIDIVVPSKMAAGRHFVKSCVSIWNGQKCEQK